jgi:hypothetical protein
MGLGTTRRWILLRWNQSSIPYLVLVQASRNQGQSLRPLYPHETHDQDRTFGEIDVLFEHKVPARKFKYTKADRKSSTAKEGLKLTICRICRL